MSWFGSIMKGGHNTHNKPNPGEYGRFEHIHHPVIIDRDGLKHPLAGYAEGHNMKHVMVKTEEVVKYRHSSGNEDHEYNPLRKEAYGTGDKFSAKIQDERAHDESVRGPIKYSPRDNGYRYDSPPPKDHHHPTRGKNSNFYSDSKYASDDGDDVHANNTRTRRPNNLKEQEYYTDEKNKRNGFAKEDSRPNYHKDHENYYENENPRTNSYIPHRVPISTNLEKEKEVDYPTQPRMGPFGSRPTNQTNDESSNFKAMAHSPPQFIAQPRKEEGNYYQETIDSNEARKRYGKASEAGSGFYPQDKHSGATIDSKEAARRYNGVLLTD